jgi:hypothetical protein
VEITFRHGRVVFGFPNQRRPPNARGESLGAAEPAAAQVVGGVEADAARRGQRDLDVSRA